MGYLVSQTQIICSLIKPSLSGTDLLEEWSRTQCGSGRSGAVESAAHAALAKPGGALSAPVGRAPTLPGAPLRSCEPPQGVSWP